MMPIGARLLLTALVAVLAAQSSATVSFDEGPAALAIGQDLASIQSYTEVFGPSPAFAVMSYVSLANLTGLEFQTDYGSGVEFAKGALREHPSAHLQLGLYLVDLLEDTANGLLDKEIDHLGLFTESVAPRHAFVRVGYECDGPQNHHEPELFKASRHHTMCTTLVAVFRLQTLLTVAPVATC